MNWTFNTLQHYNQYYWFQRLPDIAHIPPQPYEFLSQTDQHNNHTSHFIRHLTGWQPLPKNMVLA